MQTMEKQTDVTSRKSNIEIELMLRLVRLGLAVFVHMTNDDDDVLWLIATKEMRWHLDKSQRFSKATTGEGIVYHLIALNENVHLFCVLQRKTIEAERLSSRNQNLQNISLFCTRVIIYQKQERKQREKKRTFRARDKRLILYWSSSKSVIKLLKKYTWARIFSATGPKWCNKHFFFSSSNEDQREITVFSFSGIAK